MPMDNRLLAPRASGFNPSTISGLGLWMDASDSSTLTLNSGNVSELRDKSGNGRDFSQGTAAQQPGLTSIYGKVAIAFSSSVLLGNAASKTIFRNVSAATVVAVASTTTENFRYLFMASTNNSSVSPRVSIGQNTSPSEWFMSGRRLDGFSTYTVKWPGTSPPSGPNVISAIFDFGNSDWFFYGNGSLVNNQTPPQSAGNTNNNDSQAVALGANSNIANDWDGDFGELLVWPKTLSDDERQDVERYLSRKWGIALA